MGNFLIISKVTIIFMWGIWKSLLDSVTSWSILNQTNQTEWGIISITPENLSVARKISTCNIYLSALDYLSSDCPLGSQSFKLQNSKSSNILLVFNFKSKL